MVNLEMREPIESPSQKVGKDFERVKWKFKNNLEYKDSKWEKILITKKDNEICIYKAQDPNKFISVAPGFQNIKSRYALIKNGNWSFSLETKTYTVGRGMFSHEKSHNKVDDLDVNQIRNSLKTFETRINEANALAQNVRNKQYKKMQQYAYNEETQDKLDADMLLQENWLA